MHVCSQLSVQLLISRGASVLWPVYQTMPLVYIRFELDFFMHCLRSKTRRTWAINTISTLLNTLKILELHDLKYISYFTKTFFASQDDSTVNWFKVFWEKQRLISIKVPLFMTFYVLNEHQWLNFLWIFSSVSLIYNGFRNIRQIILLR